MLKLDIMKLSSELLLNIEYVVNTKQVFLVFLYIMLKLEKLG